MAAVSLKRLCEEFLLPEEERYINLPPTDSYPDVELEDPELKRGVQPAGKVDPLQLAIHNINTFKKNQPLTKPQDEALKKMKTWIEKYTAAEMTKLSSSAMSRFVLTFSKVFFLKDMPTKKMVVKFEKLNRKGKILYGDSKHLGKDKHRIRLDPRDHSRAKGVADHKIALLGTLFHECNHAYIDMFCCDANHNRKKFTPCRNGDDQYQVGAGHITAWWHLTAAIDIALEKLLGLGTDLSVFKSVLVEYDSDEGARYPAEEWKRFFANFGWEGVDYLVCKLPEGHFKRFGHALVRNADGNVINVLLAEYRKKFGP